MKPIYAYLKSSSLAIVTAIMVISFHALDTSAQAGNKPPVKGYGKATYSPGQAGKFMRTWLVAGPFTISSDSIAPDEPTQEKAFRAEFAAYPQIRPGQAAPAISEGKKEFNWQLVSPNSDVINLDTLFKAKDYVYAYAMSEIKTDKAENVMLALGSDDGVKVWLNGKLVHENWIPRGVEKDNDLVPLQLVKGSNQLLLKVQDINLGWGFVARLLDKEALATQLTRTASMGIIDKAMMLIDHGADINKADKNGFTPLMAARISGRNELAQQLLKKGAIDTPVPSPATIVDLYYSSLNGKTRPAIALLVANDGKAVYRKAFGYADIGNKVKADPETRFRIGSVTKQFTAAAILKLQERGLLSVNDKLSKFLPDFPRGDEVTIHHLLTHTSGIRSYTNKGDFLDRVTKTIQPDSLIAFFKDDPYDFSPGERYMYNNSAYFLLGYIISKVSGKSYDAYLKSTFFEPLQMNNTGVHYAGIRLEKEALGYTKKADDYEPGLNWDMSWAGGAGAMYSTVDDLLKWNNALHNGKVLDDKSYQAMITPVVLKSGQEAFPKYGYGLGMYKFRGKEIIGHSGGLHGFITQLVYYPQEKLTIAMFSNTSEPEVNFNPDKIAEAFLWNRMDSQASVAEAAVKPADLQVYTGRFEIANVGVLTLTTADNRLYSQLSGQPKFEIFPGGKDEFFWKVVEARLKFGRNEKGEIDHAILYQNGHELKAVKLQEEKIIDIDTAVFATYAGKYKMNNNITVTIFSEKNKLFAQPTDQPRLELQPVSETEFVIKEINAKVTFVKDEAGKVTKITVNMNGGNSDMPRIE